MAKVVGVKDRQRPAVLSCVSLCALLDGISSDLQKICMGLLFCQLTVMVLSFNSGHGQCHRP